MQFLKTLFWVVLAIVAAVFAMNNWQQVQVLLWGGLILEIKLPILVFGAFLIGFLPTYGWHHAARWRLQRRIESQARALADIRGVDPAPGLTTLPPSPTEPPVVVTPDRMP